MAGNNTCCLILFCEILVVCLLLQDISNSFLNFETSESKDSKSSKTPTPSVVLENLRLTLSDYRKRLDNTSEEVNIHVLNANFDITVKVECKN